MNRHAASLLRLLLFALLLSPVAPLRPVLKHQQQLPRVSKSPDFVTASPSGATNEAFPTSAPLTKQICILPRATSPQAIDSFRWTSCVAQFAANLPRYWGNQHSARINAIALLAMPASSMPLRPRCHPRFELLLKHMRMALTLSSHPRTDRDFPPEFLILQYKPRPWVPADSLAVGKLIYEVLVDNLSIRSFASIAGSVA